MYQSKMTRQRLFIPSRSFAFFQENTQNLAEYKASSLKWVPSQPLLKVHVTNDYSLANNQANKIQTEMSYSNSQKQPSRELALPTVPSQPFSNKMK